MPLGDAIRDLLQVAGEPARDGVTRLPTAPESVPNNARHEFLFDACDGLPPARQKRLIVRAAMPEVGFIEADDARVLLSALGLEGA